MTETTLTDGMRCPLCTGRLWKLQDFENVFKCGKCRKFWTERIWKEMGEKGS